MADDGESLESWLNKATNPSNRQEDWEYIMGFCDQINKELEGPQISVRLLAHKIQSPQEWEAMQALTVLGACMKNCGRRFHNEVAKFRFLNELIKVVSPKYLGDRVSDKVKTKVIEILYSWTVSLPDEAKICEAYQMLKSQGIVSIDPEIPLDATLIPSPSPRPKNPVFDDEKKSKRLADLLKSKKPEDLQEANRLIKNMVKEDEARTEKATKQKRTLEAVHSSVKLLSEMLAHFNPQDSTDADKELIKDLYGDCDKLRQTVFQLATETEDDDSSLGDILQASDDLSHVMNSYKKIVEGQAVNGEAEEARQTHSAVRQATGSSNQSEILIDLVGLDVQSVSLPQQQQQQQQPPTSSASIPADLLCQSAASEPLSLIPSAPSAALSLLDEELLSLGLNEPTLPNKSTSLQGLQDSGQDVDLFDITSSSSLPAFSTSAPFPDSLPATSGSLSPLESLTASTSALSFQAPGASKLPFSTDSVSPTFPQPAGPTLDATFPAAPQQPSAAPAASQARSASYGHGLQDLALLDLRNPESMSQVHSLKSEDPVASGLLSSSPGVASATSTSSLLAGSTQPVSKSAADDSPLFRSLSPILPLSHASPARLPEASLANVFVPLEAIKPSHLSPVTAYDKNGVRVLLHFATNCPAGRPDVLVMVASMLNTAPLPVRDIVLQAAVPKIMKVRLQTPSGTELAPFNPILPPAAVTQVILLANPLKEKVRMRYKLMFTLGEMSHTEVGEVNEFPPADRWGAL